MSRASGLSPIVRPATRSDVAAMFAMVVELAQYEREPGAVEGSESELARALFTGDLSDGAPALHGIVAEMDGEVVGMALWFLNYSTWRARHGIYLEDLYVRPQARGAGVGKALLSELANLCVERGFRRLEWSVLDWNMPAIGFYRSLGAVPMQEWTVFRLTDDALAALAAQGSGHNGHS